MILRGWRWRCCVDCCVCVQRVHAEAERNYYDSQIIILDTLKQVLNSVRRLPSLFFLSFCPTSLSLSPVCFVSLWSFWGWLSCLLFLSLCSSFPFPLMCCTGGRLIKHELGWAMPAPHRQILQNNVSRMVLFCQRSSLVWSVVLPVFYYLIFIYYICLVWCCFILAVWKSCIVTVTVWFCQCCCTNIVLPLLIFVVVLCCRCCSFVLSVQQSCFDIVKVLSCGCSNLILLLSVQLAFRLPVQQSGLVMCCYCWSFVLSVWCSSLVLVGVAVLFCRYSSLVLIVLLVLVSDLVQCDMAIMHGYGFTLKENSWHQSSSRDA